MLQSFFIKQNKEKVIEGLKKRYSRELGSLLSIIRKILCLLDDKRKIQLKIDALYLLLKNIKHKANTKEKTIIISHYDKFYIIKHSIMYKNSIIFSINKELLQNLLRIPNIPMKYVKKGFSTIDNEIIFKYGAIHLAKNLSHWDLLKQMELINLELGTKISGSGFYISKGKVAKLHRAMIEYFLEYNLQKGYMEYTVPFLVKPLSAKGTGQLPDKEGQMYYLYQDNLYLISTGEISLINCYSNVVLQENNLPIKMTTYTTCFRREAGSYGTSVRGLNRLHQFDKVEIIQITTPSESTIAIQVMVQHVKELLVSLKLPFRLIRLHGGDMGFTSTITYDFEVFSYAQKQWLEVSSISNCTNYQSNRLKLRYKKNHKGKTYICHTLNGSSIAIQRILAVLLENYQTDKSIEIPETLIPYTGFKEIIFS